MFNISSMTKRGLICGIHQFPSGKYSHCGQFQATNLMSLNTKLARDMHRRLGQAQPNRLYHTTEWYPLLTSLERTIYSTFYMSHLLRWYPVTESYLPRLVSNLIIYLWIAFPSFPISVSPVLHCFSPGSLPERNNLHVSPCLRLFLWKAKVKQKLTGDMTILSSLNFFICAL